MATSALSAEQVPSLLVRYLQRQPISAVDPGATAFYASLDHVRFTSPTVASAIANELKDQRTHLKLIASENFSSLAVQLAQGNLFTDKYAEGYPNRRFYAGCANVDTVESEAAQLAKELFAADHAYVQPHSGADANLVAFLAILSTRIELPALAGLNTKDPAQLGAADWEKIREQLRNQRMLGMDYYSGGHLTHGYRHNISSRLFDAHSYSVDRNTERLNLDTLHARVNDVRPLILLAGYSAYTRKINFAKLREIADEAGAVLMVDMAHFAGLVAGKVFTGDYDPIPHAHVVTTTTHKTLRGPRGGMVLCTNEFAEAVNKGCPSILGGPLPHAIAAKAVAFREALQPDFTDYAHRTVHNAAALACEFQARDVRILTGGTDNHIVLIDVAASYGLTGRQAELAMRECGLTVNRNSLPFDANGPWYTSGLRLGTAAVTTLGMGSAEMAEIADVVNNVLANVRPAAQPGKPNQLSRAKFTLDSAIADQARKRVADLLHRYPLYPQLDLDLVTSSCFDHNAPVGM